MHEASIALSILDIAEKECRLSGFERVQSISVNVGSASGVLPAALLAAFDIVKTGSISEQANLLINEIQLGGRCGDCKGDFETKEQFILYCPICGGKSFRIERGRELDVTEIEVE